MKKYIPVDFDEKGNVILGNAKNNPTSNGFIPTTWAPGGGSEDEGNGIKSITISPAITTTPALDSVFPIYYEDLTEEQKRDGLMFVLQTDAVLTVGDEYTFTVTPTPSVCIGSADFGGKGEPITATAQVVESQGVNGLKLVDLYVSTTPEPQDVSDILFVVRHLAIVHSA